LSVPAGWKIYEIDAGAISHIAVDKKAHEFIAFYQGSPTSALLDHCLHDSVIPRLLALENSLVLHAGVVSSIHGAIGFLGQSGQGKSTLVGSLSLEGFEILSDDSVLLNFKDGVLFAERVSSHLRLHLDSANVLFPNASTEQFSADAAGKKRFSLTADCERAPLIALFVLGTPNDAVEVVRLKVSDACMAIVSNTFAIDPGHCGAAAGRLEEAARVAKEIPVFNLTYPRDYSVLPAIEAAISAAIRSCEEMEPTR
jgi:hypothetical protein